MNDIKQKLKVKFKPILLYCSRGQFVINYPVDKEM